MACLEQYVARRERAGAELVFVLRSLAPRPGGEIAPCR
jgi:hypothetical protein